jgi:DNA/RNA non-specific endonuclease
MSSFPGSRSSPWSDPLFEQRSVVPSDRYLLGRLPGSECVSRDAGVLVRAGYVSQAWDISQVKYAANAIVRHTSQDFHEILSGLLDGLLLSIKIVGGTTAAGALIGGGVGVFVFGAGAAPGAAIGARLGFALGTAILEWLGLGFLMVYIASHIGQVGSKMQSGATTAWNSCGAPDSIDRAARDFGDAIGIFFSLILQAIVADLAKEMGGAAKGRISEALAKLRDTKLFKKSPAIEEYLVKNYDQLKEEYETQSRADGIRPDAPLPDIASDFEFREFMQNGKTYKTAKGELGTPGRVVQHRSKYAQSKLSSGTGDDAGHLIGNQFGAPGDAQNLSLQNWKMNQGGGTFHDLESVWAEKLKLGVRIKVEVTDITKAGENRPFVREVTWTETNLDGSVKSGKMTFGNFETEKGRIAKGIPPTVDSPQTNNVIPFDRGKQ